MLTPGTYIEYQDGLARVQGIIAMDPPQVILQWLLGPHAGETSQGPHPNISDYQIVGIVGDDRR